jgi:Flp pilus assembly pilin Flp
VDYKTVSTAIQLVVARLRREDGQTLAEYGMLLAVIVVVVVAAAVLLGSSISSLFDGTTQKL